MEQTTPVWTTPARRRVRWSFVLAGVAVVGAVLALIIMNTGTTAEYDMTIPQLRTCTACAGHTVRVEGNVAPNSVQYLDGRQSVNFVIYEGSDHLPVTYSGVIPDVFKSGAQVVVEGQLTGNTFHATSLLTKCPSKYQATPGSGNPNASGTSGSSSLPSLSLARSASGNAGRMGS